MSKDPGRILIFDTTLRDGEQSPGASLNLEEKLAIAHQLARLGVDVIEAGFPFASPGDFKAVNKIANVVGKENGPIICGLARASKGDIKACYEAVSPAPKKRIHTFIATSDIHLKHKLKKSRKDVLQIVPEMVNYAKSLVDDIEFSCEDASRSDPEFLYEVIQLAITAGATTINIPDTVGFTTPSEFGNLVADINKNVPNIDEAVISVHGHNDLGLAVANFLEAVKNGARQLECTINGIGERAGNASLEELVMALHVRKSFFNSFFKRNPDSPTPLTAIRTETYIATKVFVDNWRWQGVPFYLRTGKRLPKRLGEIVLTFKDVPVHLFESTIINPAPNQLILRIQPNEGSTFKFEVKSPGSGMKSRPVEMEFSYDESFGEPSDEGYVRLLADAMLSDPTLFTRSDEVEAAWKLYTPLIELMDNSPWKLPIYNYESMTWGPPESDQLISKDNMFWRRP